MSKTLAQMTAEIDESNRRLGWRDTPVTFREAMAMLHSEVSEALEAWRQWGIRDATAELTYTDQVTRQYALAKPEGVGSEFADIFIRLLDDAWLFGPADLEAAAGPGRFGISESFPENMNTLHLIIARACMAWEDGDPDNRFWNWKREFGNILAFLRQLCEHYGISLPAEYERKMQFSKSRPYRHGNKRI